MFIDGFDVSSEIEQPAHPVYDLLQSLHSGEVNGDAETVFQRKVFDFDESALAADFDGSFVDVFFYGFNSCNGSCS